MIHMKATTTDNVRAAAAAAAAAELEAMLSERGLVASELTDAEIRAAVGQMEQEGSGGRDDTANQPAHIQRLLLARDANLGQAILEREAEPSKQPQGEVNAERVQEIIDAEPSGDIAMSLGAQTWADDQVKISAVAMFTPVEMADTIEIARLIAKVAGANEVAKLHMYEAASYVKLGEASQRMATMYRNKSGGVVYDQLPESIDIDGVARPTRNPEGAR